MATTTEILSKLSSMIADWQLYLDNLANWSGGTGTKPLQDAAGNQRQVKTPHELDRLHTSAINNLNDHMADIENAHANAQSAIASKNAAKASELKSKDWATKASVVESGLHSSKTYASQSGTSASQSLASKNAAKTSETNALASKNAAATSASQALTYKNNSASSATLSQNWASKSGSAVSGSLWSSKHYSEVSKSHADRIMNAGHQFFLYDSNRTYRTGEICYQVVGGNVVFYQMYAGPNMTCVNKNPQDSANRHDGWASSTTPFWWIEYNGNNTGQCFYWIRNTAPDYAVVENNVNLDTRVYWRLAQQYPNLVNTSTHKINTGDVRGRFLRSQPLNSSLDSGRSLNSHQDSATQLMTGHFHFLSIRGFSGSGPFYPGPCKGYNYNGAYNGGNHASAYFNNSRSVRTASEDRPYNISRTLCICI